MLEALQTQGGGGSSGARIKNVSKLQIYLNAYPLKTADEVRAATGANAVVNLQLYDMKTFRPCCHLVADGIVLAEDAYNYVYGYGFHDKVLIRLRATTRARCKLFLRRVAVYGK
jgi:hypothetical protein